MLKRIVALLCALLLASAPAAGAESALVVKSSGEYIPGVVNLDDWLRHDLPAIMGAGGEWYVIALCQTGEYDLSAAYTALLDYLDNHTVRAASTRQKLALTLLALGSDHAFIQSTLADSIGKQGLMSWVWGLHLLNNGCESPEYTSDGCIKTLLELQKTDGGWAVTGTRADADATAMVLQALAPHRDRADVAAAIDQGLACLSALQNDRGGFSSFGVENAESAAQVIIALCALGIDPAADARFIKSGLTVLDALDAYYLPDELSFSHELGGEASESAKTQAFLAMAAYQRFQAGKGSIFLLDEGTAADAVMSVWNWQVYAAVAIGSAALLVCIILLLMGKHHPKNFLAVAVIAAALLAGVFLLEVESAESYYNTPAAKENAVGTVNLTIRCDKVAGRAAHIPVDGLILAQTEMPIAAGDTVYTVLTDAARAHGIHMEASGAQGLMYVHGIGNIYEFDFGDLSGWVYSVNGERLSVGCGQYVLQPGDRVEWRYTLEMGQDF